MYTLYFSDLINFELHSFILCSYALVHIEMKNQGEDAFKAEQYGDIVIIERRILESSSTTVLKNYQGFERIF